MRLWSLFKGEVRFQWKYGFYMLYAVFTALYVLIIGAVGESARTYVAAALIFTDPAAMGLFFMGAIVLMEKSQRVNCTIAVSPVRISEYIWAKVLSLAAIGMLVALILALAAGTPDLGLCMLGVFCSSVLCSMCGLIAAMRVSTLNQFLVFSVPFEMLICLPPAALLLNVWHPAMLLHPGAAAVLLICGEAQAPVLCLLSVLVWAILVYIICLRETRQSFRQMGGAKL